MVACSSSEFYDFVFIRRPYALTKAYTTPTLFPRRLRKDTARTPRDIFLPRAVLREQTGIARRLPVKNRLEIKLPDPCLTSSNPLKCHQIFEVLSVQLVLLRHEKR